MAVKVDKGREFAQREQVIRAKPVGGYPRI